MKETFSMECYVGMEANTFYMRKYLITNIFQSFVGIGNRRAESHFPHQFNRRLALIIVAQFFISSFAHTFSLKSDVENEGSFFSKIRIEVNLSKLS